MIYIVFLFSVSHFEGIQNPVNYNPPNYHSPSTAIYVDSPLALSTTLSSIHSYSNITNPSSSNSLWIWLFLAFASVGLAVSGVISSVRGTPKPAILHLLLCMVVYFGFVRPGGFPGTNVYVSSYSEVNNWNHYFSKSSTVPNSSYAPIGLGFILKAVGSITKMTTDFANSFGYNFSHVSYRAFPYLVGDAINNLLESKLGNAEYVDMVDKYVKKCVAPSIARAYKNNGNLPVSDVSEVINIADDIKVADPFSQEMVSCNTYWNRVKTQLNNSIEDFYVNLENEASNTNGGNPGKRETLIKNYGASQFLLNSASPSLSDATDMTSGITASHLISKTLSDYTNFSEHTNPQRNIFFKGFSKVFGSMSEWGTSFLGGIIGDTVWRAFPYIQSFAISLFFLGLPIVLLFAVLPGGGRILMEYIRGLVWVFSWLPFSVAVRGLVNSFVRLNTLNQVIAGLTEGVVDLGTIHRLSTTGAISTGVGSILLILVPIISYMIIARGTFTGILAGFSSVTASMVGAGSLLTNKSLSAGQAMLTKGKSGGSNSILNSGEGGK